MKTKIIALTLLFSVSGCAVVSAFFKSYGTCLEGKGLAVATSSTVPDLVVGILTSGNPKDTALSALEGLAMQFGSDAVNCSVLAWEQSNPLPKTGAANPKHLAAFSIAREWQKRHGV